MHWLALIFKMHHRYTLNQEAFDVATDEASYWLGFIMADGCVMWDYRHRTPTARLRINLNTCDIVHLQKLKGFLQYSGIVGLRDNNRYCSLEISSNHLVESLREYGITERKSRTATVIKLNDSLHFWRGLIDGDGTLYLSKKMYPQLSLCGSESILNQFADYVKRAFPDIQKVSIRKCASIKQLSFGGEKAIALVNHFYFNCPIALERKLRIAERIISLRAHSPS